MTGLILSIGLFFVILYDARLLRRQNADVYRTLLRYSPEHWAVASLLLFVIAAPVYLVRRIAFIKTIDGDRRQPGIEDFLIATRAFGIIIAWALLIIFFSLILYGTRSSRHIFTTQLEELVLVAAFSFIILTICIYRVTRRFPYSGFLTAVGLRAQGRSRTRLIVLPLLLGVLFAFCAATALVARQSIPSTPLSEALETNQSGVTFSIFLILAIIVAPLIEEIVFRGYFFSVIERFKGIPGAVCVSALVFAVLHAGQYWGDWLAIAVVAALGFSLSTVRAWTGSTIASVVMHYAYNGCITILPIIMLVWSNPSFYEYVTMYSHLNYQEKERLLRASLRDDAKYADAYNDLAWLYATQNKNLDEALKLIDRALSYDAENPAYLDTKAEVLYRCGLFDDAIAIEEALAAEDPANAFYRKRLKQFRDRAVLTE